MIKASSYHQIKDFQGYLLLLPFFFFSNTPLSILLVFNIKNVKSRKNFLLNTKVLIALIIHWLLQFNVHKVDYPGVYALHFSSAKKHPSIFSSYRNKYSPMFLNRSKEVHASSFWWKKTVWHWARWILPLLLLITSICWWISSSMMCPWSRRLSLEYVLAATEVLISCISNYMCLC